MLQVRALEDKEKKPYDQIGLAAKALQSTLEELRRKISDLEKQVKAKEERLGFVGEYELLKKGLDDLAIGPQGVNGFVAFHRQLVDLGFTQEYATAFATALDIRKLMPKDAAEVLAQALKKYDSLDLAVRELEEQKSKLEAGIRPLKVEEEAVEAHVGTMQAHLEELRKTEAALNDSIEGTRDAIDDLSKKGPASLTRIVDDAIEELERARGEAVRKLQDAVNIMNDDVKASAGEFSKAATDVKTQATEASKVMDALSQEAFELGMEVEGLEPIGRTYRFISEGTGEPKEVIPWAVKFMEQLSKWELGHFGPRKTTWLDSAIEETKKNWANSPKG